MVKAAFPRAYAERHRDTEGHRVCLEQGGPVFSEGTTEKEAWNDALVKLGRCVACSAVLTGFIRLCPDCRKTHCLICFKLRNVPGCSASIHGERAMP